MGPERGHGPETKDKEGTGAGKEVGGPHRGRPAMLAL